MYNIIEGESMKKQAFANIALFLTALIWGLSFVAQRAGMDYIGPFTFNTVRSFLGGLSLIPVIFLVKLFRKDSQTKQIKHEQHKMLLKAGLCCGFVLFIAISIQQYSMKFVDAGRAGFISALYIIYVPLISMFFGQKLEKNVKISVCVAVVGLYLLCFKGAIGGFSIYDLLILISAFFYGVHILVVNHFSQKVDAVRASCIQFFVVGILSIPLMLLFESPTISGIIACHVPILYAGILTCGVAYTLQIFGQKFTLPVVASLILCTESIFAVIGGMLILSETMAPREIVGCVLMIFAVALSQIQSKEYRHTKKSNQLSSTSTLNSECDSVFAKL